MNILTADDKYSPRNMQIFAQQRQKPISPNQETFYQLVIAFMKSTSSLEHFEKKYESPSLSISEIIYSEGGGI